MAITDTTPCARLHEAARRNDAAAVRAALATAAVDCRDARGGTPLLTATRADAPEAARALIEAGADVNARDEILDSPLLYAGAAGRNAILRLCLRAGPDFTVTNRYGGTPLIPACERGHVETVRLLLEESDVPVDHVNRLGWTGLLEAIVLSDGGPPHQEIVRLLAEHGADVHLSDGDGVTPLRHARDRGYREIARVLEAAGATH